jgi:hypothetical protein
METKSSLLHSQAPTTCPYPEPEQSSPCRPSHVLKIHFNIILPVMPRSSKWSSSLRSSHQNPARTSPVPHTSHMPSPSHSAWFDHPNDTLWGVQSRKLLVIVFSTTQWPRPSYAQISSWAPYSQTPSYDWSMRIEYYVHNFMVDFVQMMAGS